MCMCMWMIWVIGRGQHMHLEKGNTSFVVVLNGIEISDSWFWSLKWLLLLLFFKFVWEWIGVCGTWTTHLWLPCFCPFHFKLFQDLLVSRGCTTLHVLAWNIAISSVLNLDPLGVETWVKIFTTKIYSKIEFKFLRIVFLQTSLDNGFVDFKNKICIYSN